MLRLWQVKGRLRTGRLGQEGKDDDTQTDGRELGVDRSLPVEGSIDRSSLESGGSHQAAKIEPAVESAHEVETKVSRSTHRL